MVYYLVSILSTSWEVLQRQISVFISLPMIVQLGKTLLLLNRSADYALENTKLSLLLPEKATSDSYLYRHLPVAGRLVPGRAW